MHFTRRVSGLAVLGENPGAVLKNQVIGSETALRRNSGFYHGIFYDSWHLQPLKGTQT